MQLHDSASDALEEREYRGDVLFDRLSSGLEVRGATSSAVVRGAIEELSRYLGATLARLYLVEPAGRTLRYAGGWESSPIAGLRAAEPFDPAPLGRNDALPGHVWAKGETAWVDNLHAESAAGRDPRRHPSGTRTAVALPLAAGGAVYGVLEFCIPHIEHVGKRRLQGIAPALRILGEGLARLRAEERVTAIADGSCVLVLRKGVAESARGKGVGFIGRPSVASLLDRFPIAFANPAFIRITRYTEEEIEGLDLGSLMGPETDPKVANRILKALESGQPLTAEFLAYRRDGTTLPLRFDFSPVTGARGGPSHFVATVSGDPEVLAPIEVKRVGADPLTDLGNRLLMDDALRRAGERSEKNRAFRYAIFFVDLDNFKRVNDKFGHLVGDQVLVGVARQLEAAIRPGDVLARFGGDEFVILIEVVGGVHDLLAVADRITERLRRPIQLPDMDLDVTASIGIALSDAGHASVADVLKEADAAMYLAKKAGGARYRIFDLALQEAALVTQRTRAALKQSLERGEFQLHYQPMVDLASGRVAALEALLRWNHPERGILPAGEFIGDAEDMGLIIPIGRWVIAEACREIRSWRKKLRGGAPLVSVNVSTRELLDPTLAEWLRSTLDETGADPAWLRLEIPEGFLVRAGVEAHAILRPLLDLGIRIGIGDFGRGNSPLGLLNQIPVDILKVDRQFVTGLFAGGATGNDGNDARALRSILALGNTLGVQVSASGVETSGQEEILRQLAYPYAQGNRFSEPVDAIGAALLLQRDWAPMASARTVPRGTSVETDLSDGFL